MLPLGIVSLTPHCTLTWKYLYQRLSEVQINLKHSWLQSKISTLAVWKVGIGLCTWRSTQSDSSDQSWYKANVGGYIYVSISALHIDLLSGVVTALKTLMWEWPGPQTRTVNSQFSSSKVAETFPYAGTESGVYFWGSGWQGMNTATQTEQRPSGKSRNRSTSHHQWQIHERNAWEGLKKENEDKRVYENHVQEVFEMTQCEASFQKSQRGMKLLTWAEEIWRAALAHLK